MKKLHFVVQENDEKIVPFIWINGMEKEVSIEVELYGDNSSAKIIGIFFGYGTSSVVFNTNVKHNGKNTWSRTNIRGVFQQKSMFNNNGMIHITNGAAGADGYFTSKILLFDDAKGRSVPSLEIDENDLKAGHASTIGRPDEQQLFYMRSRGLSEKDAEKLLVQGFFEPLILELPKQEQKQLKQQLEEVLGSEL